MSALSIQNWPKESLCYCELESKPHIDFGILDPCFIPRHWSGWYQRAPAELRGQLSEFFAHRITRSPKDLAVHVHRIIYQYYYGNSESLYGALLDLFIVLGDKGQPLRERLYHKLESALDKPYQAALSGVMASGVKSQSEVVHTPYARLLPTLSRSSAIVERASESANSVEFSVLDEARDLVDSGFLDEARMLLEEAFVVEPQNEEISKDLLDLYKYTRNRDAFAMTRERLGEMPFALNQEWDALAKAFEDEEERLGNE